MQTKDYKILKQYWNPNNVSQVVFLAQQDLEIFLHSHSIREMLSERELILFRNLKSRKRKADWMLGRYAAKLLLQDYYTKQQLRHTYLTNIELLPQQYDKPTVEIQGIKITGIDVSLSHTEDAAVAALVTKKNMRIGVDIEKNRRLNAASYTHFLSNTELSQIEEQNSEKDSLVLLFWTLKEACLKALRIGLNGSLKGIAVTNIVNSQTTLTISLTNLKQAAMQQPKKIQAFHKIINEYTIAIILLET